MAEKQIKTRLQMIGGLTSEWATASAANKKLLANEIAVEWESRDEDGNYTGFIGMKVGDGIHTFEGLDYFGGEEAHVFTDIIPTATETHTQAIERAVGDTELAVGDIAIIKELIAGDKYAYTSYVYSEIETKNEDDEIVLSYVWKATDGNYSADNVYFDNDLTMTANIGAQTLASGQSSKVLSTAGKSLDQVMKMILAVEKAPNTLGTGTANSKNPSVTTKIANGTNATPGTSDISVEGGTTIYPRWNATFNPGSYTYGPATGVTAKTWSVVDNRNSIDSTQQNQKASTVDTQSFGSLVLPAGQSYKVTATATYDAGAIAHTNLGEEYKKGNDLFDKTSGAAIVQITAGSKSDDSPVIKAWQQGCYIGTLESADTVITSNILRNTGDGKDVLKNRFVLNANYSKQTLKFDGTSKYNNTVLNPFSGTMAKIIIAYPASITSSGLTYFFNDSAFEEYTNSFTTQTLKVAGADNDLTSDHAVDYIVRVYSPAAAFTGSTKFTITLG